MEYESALARYISGVGDNAALDAVCKRLLANKSILAWILKDCVEEYRDCDMQDIAEKYIENEPQIAEIAVNSDETNTSIRGMSNEDATVTEGTVTYDIRFMASAPVSGELIQLIINIEAQNDFYPGYPLIKRGIYYCSRMMSAQYGTEFTQSHYGDIKKVYSIWICANPPKNRQNTITRYRITEESIVGNAKEDIKNYDLMTAIMICLGSEDNKADGGVLELLDVLLSSEMQAEKKKQILQNNFNIKMTETIDREVSFMCNISQGIEAKSMARGMEKGIQQGMEKGMRQGMEKGMEKGMLLALRTMIDKLKMTPEQAMEMMDISKEEYSKYNELLRESVQKA